MEFIYQDTGDGNMIADYSPSEILNGRVGGYYTYPRISEGRRKAALRQQGWSTDAVSVRREGEWRYTYVDHHLSLYTYSH